jgi:hypothetical protein
MESDLSLDNIDFLRAVRDVMSSPDAFADTDVGETAATTGAVRQASDLDYDQVSYRMDKSSKLASEGYIEVYPGQYDPDIGEDGGFGQRSAELTEKGASELSKVEDEMMGGEVSPKLVEDLVDRVEQLESGVVSGEGGGDGEVDASVREDIESLQANVESLSAAVGELEDEVQRVSDGLAAVEKSEWGGVSESKKTDLSLVVERLPQMFYILKFVLGMDVDMVREHGGEIPDEMMGPVREGVLRVLEGEQDRAVESLEQRGRQGGQSQPRENGEPVGSSERSSSGEQAEFDT